MQFRMIGDGGGRQNTERIDEVRRGNGGSSTRIYSVSVSRAVYIIGRVAECTRCKEKLEGPERFVIMWFLRVCSLFARH